MSLFEQVSPIRDMPVNAIICTLKIGKLMITTEKSAQSFAIYIL